MFTVYKKDIHSYFTTFTGYLFAACIVLVGGIYCYIYNFNYGYAGFEYSITNVPFFLVFLIPVISAGIFTDEKRQKTEQLLYTLPMTSGQIVLGKYLALLTIILIPLLILGAYPIAMSFYGEVNFMLAYSNLLAVFLLGAALCAICMFVSSLTESIVVSAVLCFGLLFLLYQMDTFSENLVGSAKNSYIGIVLMAICLLVLIWYMTKNIYVAIIPSVSVVIVLNFVYQYNLVLVAGKVNMIMDGISVFSRLDNFASSIFDVSAVVYYISIAALFVLFTIYTFERKRWK